MLVAAAVEQNKPELLYIAELALPPRAAVSFSPLPDLFFSLSQHVSVITTSSYCASCNVSVSSVFNAMRAVIRRDKRRFVLTSEGII